MDATLQSLLDAYFRTFNQGKEADHRALWGPDMAYFSSSLRTTVQGLASLQGVWKAIREGIGIQTITPIQTFGNAPELAALVGFKGEGGRPQIEAVMVFRFDADQRISRIGVHWDPVAFLTAKEDPGSETRSRDSLEAKDPRVQATLATYFSSFNAGDEAAHASVLDPNLSFFGSLSGVQSEGLASALGIFRSAQQSLGIRRLAPKRIFGDWPECSVLLEFGTADGQAAAEAIYTFQLDDQGKIRRLATLWNPLPYLKRIATL